MTSRGWIFRSFDGILRIDSYTRGQRIEYDVEHKEHEGRNSGI